MAYPSMPLSLALVNRVQRQQTRARQDPFAAAYVTSSIEISPMSRVWQWALVATGAAIVIFQLFVPPILGVADNGDFPKLSRHACIGPLDPARYPLFDYYTPRYAIRSQYCGSIMATSAVIPLYISLAPAGWFLPRGEYDLRFLGALYALLFLGAFFLFLRLVSQPPLVAMFALVVFFSAAYVPIFSTFYMDTAALIFLLWSVVLGIHVLSSRRVGLGAFASLTAALLFLATSKVQHSLEALCFVPLFWFRFERKAFPAVWARAAASVVVIAGSLVFLATSSPWYRAISFYDSLFFKFLPASENPAAALAKLGLDASFVQYIGRHSYSPGTHMQEEPYAIAFGKQVTLTKMLRFLLVNPKVVASAMRHDLEEGSLVRVRMEIGAREYRLGNYQPESGHLPEAQSHVLALWPAAKAALYARRPWSYLGFCFTLVALLWLAAWFQGPARAPAVLGVAVLTALLPTTFAPPFFDAVDTGRHLFLFNCVLDLCACTLLALAIRLAKPRP